MMNKYSDGTVSSSVQSDEVALGVGARQWQFAYREALSPHIFGTVLISITLVLATFTLTSPMGTDDLNWMQRLAYFSASTFLCAPLCYAKYIVVLYVTRFWPPVQITLAVAVGTLMASLPSTTIVYAVDTLIRADVPSYSLPKMYLVVASSMLLCSSVTHYMVGQRLKSGTAASPSTAPADERKRPESAGGGSFSPAAVDRAVSNAADRPVMEPPSKFPDRLPPEAGRDIIYLKMSDHYVEVVTTVGRCTILMRLADAVAELGDQGVRVHRSYWVAYAHVEGWSKRNQRTVLRLTGGNTVPISRTYLSAVQAAVARHRSRHDTADPTPTEDGSL